MLTTTALGLNGTPRRTRKSSPIYLLLSLNRILLGSAVRAVALRLRLRGRVHFLVVGLGGGERWLDRSWDGS